MPSAPAAQEKKPLREGAAPEGAPSEEPRRRLLRRLARDMIAFGQVCIPDLFQLESPPFHYELARLLQDPTERRLNIIAPRGSAKSSVVACVYVLWHLFLEDLFRGRPERKPKFVVLCSKTQSHAIRLLRTIKGVLEGEPGSPFVQLFGQWGEETARKWTSTEVILRDGTTLMAVGTGQQARGLKQGHRRPSLLILDDPEDEENTRTEARMEQNLEWLLQAVEPAVEVSEGQLVVVGTPQHQRSMVMVLRDRPDWTTRHYQALYEKSSSEESSSEESSSEESSSEESSSEESSSEESSSEESSEGDPRGGRQSLWPQKWSVEELLEMKASLKSIGRVSVFYRERQCQVVEGEDALFRSEYLRWWDGHLEKVNRGGYWEHYLHVTARGRSDSDRPLPLEEEEVLPVTVTMGVDPASSTHRRADYTAIVPLATTTGDRLYVLPYARARLAPMDAAQKIASMYERLRPRQVRIESSGYQTMLRDYLRRSSDIHVRIPGLEITEKPHEKKERRLEGLQPLFASGRVHLQPGMQAFKDELLFFPKGKHDDLLDGFFYAQKARRPPHHTLEARGEDPRRGRPRRHYDPMLS